MTANSMGNTRLHGERCRWCDSENVYGFESPAYGPSHFCAHCGVMVAGFAKPSLAPQRIGCKVANGNAPGHFGNPGPCPQCELTAKGTAKTNHDELSNSRGGT